MLGPGRCVYLRSASYSLTGTGFESVLLTAYRTNSTRLAYLRIP